MEYFEKDLFGEKTNKRRNRININRVVVDGRNISNNVKEIDL